MPTSKTSPEQKPQPAPPLADGLVYVNADMPGLTRVRSGEHFRFRDAGGQWVRDATEVARIRALAIPPAYTSVWICPIPNGHLQAVGLDARGRKQYRYHPLWRVQKDESKFERLEAFGSALPRIRARVVRDLRPVGKNSRPTRERVLATVVRLLDTTFLRVGNEEYASSNRSFGLTTLRDRHAVFGNGKLTLRFRGKSGVQHEATVDDPRIAKIVRQCQQIPGQDLFQYEDDEGERRVISSTDVNAYLREAAGVKNDAHFTAKDFRTWHGTVQALELTRLVCNGEEASGAEPEEKSAKKIVQAGEACAPHLRAKSTYSAKAILTVVARQLGNTPAVCKKAYVHPAVLTLGSRLTADPEGMHAYWEQLAGGKRPARRLHMAEHRLLRFLHQTNREAKHANPLPKPRMPPKKKARAEINAGRRR